MRWGVVVNTLELQVARGPQRLLATVLFTDIVGSTERAPAAGDRRWQSCSTTMTRAAHRWSSGKAGG
jgi:class 3 adenylate cyclase